MHFEPQAVPAEMPSLVRRFVSITTWEPWAERLAYFDRRVADNRFLDEYLALRYPTELAMGQVHRRQLHGQKIELPATYAETVLLSFVAMVARVHHRLSPVGQKRIAGMLRSGLDTEAGLAPLVHEMSVAAHLMGRGFDVTFSDIETGGGYDFLAEREGAALEVECKTVSGDLGRKIHLQRLYQLGRRILPIMTSALERRSGGQLARILLPDRLNGTDKQLKAIFERLGKVLESGQSTPEPDPCAIEFREFSLADSPFGALNPETIEREAVRQHVERAIGLPIEHMVMIFRPPSAAVMVAVESRQNDALMHGLVRQLKDSVKHQFSGTRPGVVCIKFLEVTQQGLLEIVEQDKSERPSALKLASSYLLNREDWTLVHTLAYLTPGQSIASRVVDGRTVTRSIQEQGRTYTFKNPRNAMVGDGRFSIF